MGRQSESTFFWIWILEEIYKFQESAGCIYHVPQPKAAYSKAAYVIITCHINNL